MRKRLLSFGVLLCGLASVAALDPSRVCVPPGLPNCGVLGLQTCAGAYNPIDVRVALGLNGTVLGEVSSAFGVTRDDLTAPLVCVDAAGLSTDMCGRCIGGVGPITTCGGTASYLNSTYCSGGGCSASSPSCVCGHFGPLSAVAVVYYFGGVQVNTTIAVLGEYVTRVSDVSGDSVSAELYTSISPPGVMTGDGDIFSIMLEDTYARINWVPSVNETCAGCTLRVFTARFAFMNMNNEPVGDETSQALAIDTVRYAYSPDVLGLAGSMTVTVVNSNGVTVFQKARVISYIDAFVTPAFREWFTRPQPSFATFSQWGAGWQALAILTVMVVMFVISGVIGCVGYVLIQLNSMYSCVCPGSAVPKAVINGVSRLVPCCKRKPPVVKEDDTMRTALIQRGNAESTVSRRLITGLVILGCAGMARADSGVTMAGALETCNGNGTCWVSYVANGYIGPWGGLISGAFVDPVAQMAEGRMEVRQRAVHRKWLYNIGYYTSDALMQSAVYSEASLRQLCLNAAGAPAPGTCFPIEGAAPQELASAPGAYFYRQATLVTDRSVCGLFGITCMSVSFSPPSLYGKYGVVLRNTSYVVYAYPTAQPVVIEADVVFVNGDSVETILFSGLFELGKKVTFGNFSVTRLLDGDAPDVAAPDYLMAAQPYFVSGSFRFPAGTSRYVGSALSVSAPGVPRPGAIGDVQFDASRNTLVWDRSSYAATATYASFLFTGPAFTQQSSWLQHPEIRKIADTAAESMSSYQYGAFYEMSTAGWARPTSWLLEGTLPLARSVSVVCPTLRPSAKDRVLQWVGVGDGTNTCTLNVPVYSACSRGEAYVQVASTDMLILVASVTLETTFAADSAVDVVIRAACFVEGITPGVIYFTQGARDSKDSVKSLGIAYAASIVPPPPTKLTNFSNVIEVESAVAFNTSGENDNLGFPTGALGVPAGADPLSNVGNGLGSVFSGIGGFLFGGLFNGLGSLFSTFFGVALMIGLCIAAVCGVKMLLPIIKSALERRRARKTV